jgi:hypothetical protein
MSIISIKFHWLTQIDNMIIPCMLAPRGGYGSGNNLHFSVPREQAVVHMWMLHWSIVADLCGEGTGNAPRGVWALFVVKLIIPEVVGGCLFVWCICILSNLGYYTNSPPTLTGAGDHWTIFISRERFYAWCSQWKSLVATSAGTHRSLMTHTSTCVWAIRASPIVPGSASGYEKWLPSRM